MSGWPSLPVSVAGSLLTGLVLAGGIGCGQDHALNGRLALSGSDLFTHVEIIGSRGTALGQFNKPRSLTVDREDHLYAVDLTGRVQKFSTNGRFLLSWQMPETDLGKPKGMTCDPQGHIVVIEPHYSRINHFTTNGTLVRQWGAPGTNTGQFTVPRAVTTDNQGKIYICEYSRVDRVQIFQEDTTDWIQAFGRPGRERGEFNRPEGVVTDESGNIYVADSCNHRIQIFAPDGTWLREIGRPGSGPGELSYPYDVVLDQEGRLYVCEFGNSRIQIFDRDGTPVDLIGELGSRPGQFHNPWSIELDSLGNLYVADGANHRVQKLIRKPGTGGRREATLRR